MRIEVGYGGFVYIAKYAYLSVSQEPWVCANGGGCASNAVLTCVVTAGQLPFNAKVIAVTVFSRGCRWEMSLRSMRIGVGSGNVFRLAHFCVRVVVSFIRRELLIK